MKKLFLNLPQLDQGNWWVEVMTTQPFCVYYFGPFSNTQEAKRMQPGYIQDLTKEGVSSIQAVIKQCHPTRLTIYEPEDSYLDAGIKQKEDLEVALD